MCNGELIRQIVGVIIKTVLEMWRVNVLSNL